jgi:hypothetical protein
MICIRISYEGLSLGANEKRSKRTLENRQTREKGQRDAYRMIEGESISILEEARHDVE